MSIVKTLSVGDGDMFYIKHNSDNFTTIDCCLSDDNKADIVAELKKESNGKRVTRFISTHPDEDHIQQLDYLDDKMPILNFYCVKNEATKEEESSGFKRYCSLRDSAKAFYIDRGCTRMWMNQSSSERDGAGINVLWPVISNSHFKDALKNAKEGKSPNNISPIATYSVENGAKFIWFGDLENDFMESIKDEISLPNCNVLFAPHHGRKSGRVPDKFLEEIDPDIIVMGEAPSKNLDYAGYDDYNKITQNSAGDIVFDNSYKRIDIYVSEANYSVDFLTDEGMADNYNCFYLGTLNL